MIEFKNVSKVYDTGTEAVKNATFRIEKGEFTWVGVGVIKNPALGGTTCYSVVLSSDN